MPTGSKTQSTTDTNWDEEEWTTVQTSFDDTFKSAMMGTLKSPDEPGNEFESCQIRNSLAYFDLEVSHVDFHGNQNFYFVVRNNDYMEIKNTKGFWDDYPHEGVTGEQREYVNTEGQYFVVREAGTQAFICVLEAVEGGRFHITANALPRQNLLSFPPATGVEPELIVPADGPSLLVGVGVGEGNACLARTQHWKKSKESYVLAPGQTRKITVVVSSGIRDTSSSREEVAESLNVAVHLKWGPLSASMNASLKRSSNNYQEVALSSSESETRVYEAKNNNSYPVMVIVWQICDEITIFEYSNGLKLQSQVTSLEDPGVLRIYNMADLLPNTDAGVTFTSVNAAVE